MPLPSLQMQPEEPPTSMQKASRPNRARHSWSASQQTSSPAMPRPQRVAPACVW
jgi:hypothetical protein